MASNPKKPPASKAPPPASGPKGGTPAGEEPVKKSIPEAPQAPATPAPTKSVVASPPAIQDRQDQPDLPPRLPDEPPAPRPGDNGAPATAEVPPSTMHAKAQVDLQSVPTATPTSPAPHPAGPPKADIRAQPQ